MSFIDGIVNAARSIVGLSPTHDPERPAPGATTPAPTRARSDQLATDTPTVFDRGAAAAARARLDEHLTRPTLADRLRSTQPTRAVAATRPPRDGGSIGADLGAAPRPAATASARDATTGVALGTASSLVGLSNAAAAAQHVQAGLDYYARTFGRDGLDGAGAGVDVLVDDRSTDAAGNERFAGNGGYYATPAGDGTLTEAIHFGIGTGYDAANGHVEQLAMQHADDLSIHELTHGIIRKESGHLGGDADEAGATNEGVADVMAAAATRDWSIGEGMYAAGSDYRRMRNIAQPDDPTAIHGLYTTMADVQVRRAGGDEIEEHWASGVISTAAYRVQQRIGGEQGWQAVEQVFYDTIDNDRMGDMSFTSVAQALRTSATSLYGDGSAVAAAFDAELRAAGL